LRQAFIDTLCALAADDERVVLLTGDLGYMALEPFRERFPGRFFNAGVAEQNMIGVATGLAEAGLRPYAYSIAPFASLRPFEFIRNGPVAHNLPVRIVGMGMGVWARGPDTLRPGRCRCDAYAPRTDGRDPCGFGAGYYCHS
jgi:transketolase